MNEESYLIAFKAICNFVNDLNSVYGKKHKPLKLYRRLINQTQIAHDQAIKKHISAFHNFCLSNRDCLYSQDKKQLVNKKIEYSDRVYIDMEIIFRNCDTETEPVIWNHLLTISAILDPAGKAKEILRKNAENGKSSMQETNFLTDIISKVEKNVKPDSNPIEAVSSILQSGIFNDLLSGMQGGLSSGKLDLNKLVGAVQGMVVSLGEQAGDDPEAKQAMGMVTNMTAMLGNIGSTNNNNSPPDIMQMMTTMISGMNNIPKVEEIKENKENKEDKK